MCEMLFCEIWHLFSRALIRNILWWYYYRSLITSTALEKSKKECDFVVKIILVQGKLKLLNFLMDSVLILLYGFSSYHWRWCIWPLPCGHVVRHSVEVSIPCDLQLTDSYHFDVAPLPNKMIPQCFNETMQRPKQRRLEVSRLAWPTLGKMTKIYIGL